MKSAFWVWTIFFFMAPGVSARGMSFAQQPELTFFEQFLPENIRDADRRIRDGEITRSDLDVIEFRLFRHELPDWRAAFNAVKNLEPFWYYRALFLLDPENARKTTRQKLLQLDESYRRL